MSWSLRIAQAFGIPIRVHVTFLLIVAWGALSWGSRHGAAGALFGVASTLLLFVSVALHELGHSVVAQRRGLRVREIVLLPIGGVASLEGRPSRPRDELWIALAGPAVNFALAALLGGVALGLHASGYLSLESAKAMTPSWSTLLALLVAGNLSLGLFNLLPIFPMDGGRVLRALLASRWGMERGTRWAAGFGQIAAVGMGTFAVVNGAFLLGLVAVLVFFAAGRERLETTARRALRGLRAGEVSRVPSLSFSPGEPVATALGQTLRTTEEVYPVVRNGELVAVVTRAELMFAARAGRFAEPVSAVASPAFVEVDTSAELDAVLDSLERSGAVLAVVLEENVPVGVISRDQLHTAILMSSGALGTGRPGVPASPDALR